ncbi:carbohydrate ABC transporter permease [Pseudothermotoga thermarum]|uniref:Carbohydrate ABC transporter membrane protein 2, CUT1 family n=1 Tax=Pseudothermotoga thermarum DSM 5069 TaxID=688269 RepID=F7YTI6_9THEM|nr:carbohydrate ABC transporter permease [Pseudothermotoga thermarum]AEH51200.1 carbohydrate ABC transporter membrane protein 2, CUT1 family [Pseudothermotoga thermarum DSM 5069]
MRKRREKIIRIIGSILLWIFAAFWFVPIFWMLITSLKESSSAVMEYPPRWIPDPATLNNYRRVFTPAGGISVVRGLRNSLIVATVTGILGLVIATPAAYALARMRFTGQKVAFWLYIAILAFPGIIFLVPNFLIVHSLGLMNTFAALIFPTFGTTFGVFLLRQYMLGIPRELEDAAWIDGCSRLRFLITIVIPYIKPALFVLALMTFLGSWNNFLWPLLVMQSPEKFTLPIALVRFAGGTQWNDPYRGIGALMAGSFISVAPTLLIFVVFNKYLMQGVYLGSVGKE